MKTLSTFATQLAMLVDDANKLRLGKIMMGDLITTDTELGFSFDSQLHGFITRHECGEGGLLMHVTNFIGGCLEKGPGRGESFGK